ncbi:MAG TPA: antibiotic biosynthesis monooxygenase family protein, partial [Acidobacteriaceae bacterium]|nr:antibiotic biosynthesis monooxygenase family protein [Acidobacteriaceae bacterium]
MLLAIFRFRADHAIENAARDALYARLQPILLLEGCCGLDDMTDVADPSAWFLITRWISAGAFQAWRDSATHPALASLLPDDVELDSSFSFLMESRSGNNVGDRLRNALESLSPALAQWLMESDVSLALLLGPDGCILARNRAANRIFPGDSAHTSGCAIWDYLVSSDCEHVRTVLADPAATAHNFALNLAHGNKSPISLEASFLSCGENFL